MGKYFNGALTCVLVLTVAGCSSVDVVNQRPTVPPPETKVPATGKTAVKQPRKVQLTPLTPAPTAPTLKTSGDDKVEVYTVISGDYLGKIAKKYGVRTKDLAAYNNIDVNAILKVKQKLRIPPRSYSNKAVQTAAKTDKAVKKTQNNSNKAVSNSDPAVDTASGLYIIRRGDSISRIASRLKVSQDELLAANNLERRSVLRIGRKLIIPGGVEDKRQAVATPAKKAENNSILGNDEPVATKSAAVVSTPDIQPDLTCGVLLSFDTPVDVFAAQQGVSVEALTKLNTIPADQTFRSGQLVLLPVRKN